MFWMPNDRLRITSAAQIPWRRLVHAPLASILSRSVSLNGGFHHQP
jgi:hypothetical protein